MNAIFNNVLLDGLSLPFAVEKICRLSPEWRSSSSSSPDVLKTVFALLLPSTNHNKQFAVATRYTFEEMFLSFFC